MYMQVIFVSIFLETPHKINCSYIERLLSSFYAIQLLDVEMIPCPRLLNHVYKNIKLQWRYITVMVS